MRVDDEGVIWTTHNRGGFPCAERALTPKPSARGYLIVRLDGVPTLIHRIVYAWHHGETPAGVLVRHLNDNRTDNRPSNLALGTALENAADSRRNGGYTGNHTRGTKNPNAKMTPEIVRQMRAEHRGGALQVPLARKYGLSQASAWAIVNHKTWRDVAD